MGNGSLTIGPSTANAGGEMVLGQRDHVRTAAPTGTVTLTAQNGGTRTIGGFGNLMRVVGNWGPPRGIPLSVVPADQ